MNASAAARCPVCHSTRHRQHELGRNILNALFSWSPALAVDPRGPHDKLTRKERTAKRRRRMQSKLARRRNR